MAINPNKLLFQRIMQFVGDAVKEQGFVDHPVYVPGWDAGNQAYQAELIRSDVSQYVDQLNIAFHPSQRGFRFTVTRSAKLDDVDHIDNLPTDAGAWTDIWLYKPHDEYVLGHRRLWNTRNWFYLSKRWQANPDKAYARMCADFQRNAPYLFAALDNTYKGRRISISHYDMPRPADDGRA